MRNAEFRAIGCKRLGVLYAAYRGPATAGKRKSYRNFIHQFRLAFEAGPQNDRNRLLTACKSSKGGDQSGAVDAAFQVAFEFHRALGQENRVRVAEEVGNEGAVSGPARGCRQRPA